MADTQKVNDEDAGTRQKILRAAVAAFGHHDYDAVSVRRIVLDAGANIAAVSYHFGGKKGLYLEVAHYLADYLHAGIHAELARVESRIESASAQQCRQMAAALLGRFAEALLTGPLSEDIPGFLFREQSHPTEAFDILYERLLQPLHRTLAGLAACACGVARDSTEAYMLSHALFGTVMVFRVARTTLLRRLGQQAYTDDDIAQIGRLVSELVESILESHRGRATTEVQP